VSAPTDVRPTTNRLPAGQIQTRKWPILHSGMVPRIAPADWRFEVRGLVKKPLVLDWDALQTLPQEEVACDIHCVTRWSRFDNVFRGVPVRSILERAGLEPAARAAMVHAAPDYTTNLLLGDLDRPGNLLATHHGGEPLAPEHGGPVRLLVPHLYFWKSAKWVTGFEILADDEPGFWERNGYHLRGDPWREERYGSDDYVRMRRGGRL
jgi:DMSO/TMAO reductase YedYZ molybdopterin-dependent catalytic subunit